MMINTRGFWSIITFYKRKPLMMWTTYDGYYSEYDYGYSDYYTGTRFTTKQIKQDFDKFFINSGDKGFDFTVPFFIAWLFVLPGTIREKIAEYKYFKREKHLWRGK
jgi:hypothetical protein